MTTQERADFWHEHITAWQASGLSGQAFCQQHHLAYHQFIYWRQKQDKPGSDPADSAAGFARVMPVVSDSRELTLSLPGGRSISGIHAGNVDLLGAILRQL